MEGRWRNCGLFKTDDVIYFCTSYGRYRAKISTRLTQGDIYWRNEEEPEDQVNSYYKHNYFGKVDKVNQNGDFIENVYTEK